MGMRNANIGLLVSIILLVAGAVIFKDANRMLYGSVGLISLFIGIGVYVLLDERDRRRTRRSR